jgi:transposase
MGMGAGIKGHPSAPVKGFARALQKRATVVPIDEYKTSKLCSLCHDTLEKARLLATNDDGEFELRKNRNILRCASSACRANFWNRDVNAARNMLELLRSELKEKFGACRMRAFRRDSH